MRLFIDRSGRVLLSLAMTFTINTLITTQAIAQCPSVTVVNGSNCGGTGEGSINIISTPSSGVTYQWAIDNAQTIIPGNVTNYTDPSFNVDILLTNGRKTATVSNLGSGSYTLWVRVTNSGCSNPDWEPASVFYASLPSVSAGSDQSGCLNGSAISLTGGSPSGGEWSGPGVTGDQVNGYTFTPSSAGAGAKNLIYSYTDAGTTCEGGDVRVITVYPEVTLSTQNVCGSLRAYVLSHGLSGVTGSWSGSHVSNGIFKPFEASIGNNTVSYSYTTSQGCAGTAYGTVNVYSDTPASAPTVTGPSSDICGSGAVTLSANNAGNVYDSFIWFEDGEAIKQSNGQLYTSNSYTTPTLSLSQEYEVQGVDEDCGTYLAAITAEIIPVPAAPSVNDGPNCSDGKATLSIASPNGSYTYQWTDQGGNPLPEHAETGIYFDFSSSHTVLDMEYIPGTSDYSVMVRAYNGTCASDETEVVAWFRTIPVVSLGSSIPDVSCTSTAPFNLSGGSPISGTWEINNVASTSFDSYTLGAGSHSVMYIYIDEYGCSGADSKTVTVNSLTTPDAQTIRTVHGIPANIQPPAPGTNKTYSWYDVSSGGSPFTTGDTWTSGNVTSTLIYYISLTDELVSFCESLGRGTITVYPNYLPVVNAGSDQSLIVPQRSTTLNATSSDPDGSISTTNWNKITGPSLSLGSASSSSLALNSLPNGTYVFRFTARDNYDFEAYDDVQVTVSFPPNNYNSVTTEVVRIPGKTDPAHVESLNDIEKSKTIQYIDALGRPLQQVQWRGSPNENDLVQPIVYDNFGREPIKYLPYTSTSGDGTLKEDAIDAVSYPNSKQAKFYDGTDPLIASDAVPYAKTNFEASPLNRIVEQGAPGTAWQPGSTHTIKQHYLFNGENQVLHFKYNDGKISLAPGEYYLPNSLFRNETLDEHQNVVLEYIDIQGRTICKKVKVADEVFASTYYIYDDFGNLVVVVPPEGVRAMSNP
ncbi:MAG TPA: DUF6443 domain-containing protein [Cyclobacteriaceae bacterium]|nr:DUF6443 domain-containing protein [Cyclobacteriaceae bacterium]